jgi:signal transduction histidine kinase
MHETSRPSGGSAASAMTAAPGRDPPATRTADSAETARRLQEDRDRIASEINDVVVRRLFSAGLALQSALGLMDGHQACEGIEDAVAELDQAIIDIRDSVFGTRSTDCPERTGATRPFLTEASP